MLIEISNRQRAMKFDAALLKRAVEAVLNEALVVEAEISIAVVDDATIHALNRQYLGHDYPTDVLSFVLERAAGRLEGEVVVSAQTAVCSAEHHRWSAEEELLLYVIHGTLHLVGYDDATLEKRDVMRKQEARHLAELGFESRPEMLGPGASRPIEN